MGVKDELFSFKGAVVTIVHNVFLLGAVGVMFLSVWIWTGVNPARSAVKYADQKEAIEFLLDTNPGMNVKLIPAK